MTGGTQAVHCSDFELAGSEHLNGSPFSNHTKFTKTWNMRHFGSQSQMLELQAVEHNV